MTPTLKGFTREYLASLFSYDPETGLITRLVRRSRNALVGDVIDCLHSAGYFHTQLNGKRLLAHRLAYFLHTGETPQEVDHKDLNRQNNRFENLRGASSSLNKYNIPLKSNNTSGFKGVHYCKSKRRFTAQIQVDGKYIHLGRFKTAEEAARIYDAAAVEAVGEFALTNEKMGLLKECA
jgi:hypothetical protein